MVGPLRVTLDRLSTVFLILLTEPLRANVTSYNGSPDLSSNILNAQPTLKIDSTFHFPFHSLNFHAFVFLRYVLYFYVMFWHTCSVAHRHTQVRHARHRIIAIFWSFILFIRHSLSLFLSFFSFEICDKLFYKRACPLSVRLFISVCNGYFRFH